MPILLQCDCGRAVRVKDELAGRKIRCPDCQEIMKVPVPKVAHEDEPVVLEVAITAKPGRKPPPLPKRRAAEEDDEDDAEDEEETTRRKRSSSRGLGKRKRRNSARSRDAERGGGFAGFSFPVVSKSIIAGLIMMLVAVIWFVAGLFAGLIFFYPPIMFILGVVAVFRGLMGTED
jgi:hypothetical protein